MEVQVLAHPATVDPWTDPAGTRLVGDPVDVVTGHVSERTLCFRLIGPLFLRWDRHYDSGRNTTPAGFGFGHAHSYDHRLRFDADGLWLEEPIGRRTEFAALRADGERATVRGATLRRRSLLSYRLSRPGGPEIDFDFADPERPARVARVRRDGARITFHYDADGRLIGIVHATGLRIATAEDATGRLLRLEGPWDGGSASRPMLSCEYDSAGDLVSMKDALGRHGSFAYDADHRLIRRTDRRGYSFFFEYDSMGRCVRSAGEDGVMGVVLRYRPDERVTDVTRSDGGTWRYHYDSTGSITRVIGPHGGERRFIKGESGRVTGEIDPLGQGLDYVFDRAGALLAKRFSTGREILMEAGEENPDPPFHRVADRASRFLFGDLPARLPVIAGGIAAAHQRTLVPEPEPPLPGPVVPSFGVLPWYPEPEEGREFTPFGHLIRQTLPGGGVRRWTYDPNDSMYVATDADGAVTRQERRSWNQLAARVDPLGNETLYRFTSEDQVAAVTDPGGTVTEFAYDKERRLLGVRRGGQVRDIYRYDDAGNLIEKRDGAGATMLTLVPTADRLMKECTLASGGVHRFEYNAAGRFISAAVDTSEVRFDYDGSGRRTLDARDGRGVAHDFAAAPGVETTTVLERFVIARETADRGLTIRLPGGAWTRIERPGKRVLLRTCSNRTAELCQFDGMGRCLASLVTSDFAAARRWARRWVYSAEGDLLREEDSRHGDTEYRYDPAHRLTNARRRAGGEDGFVHDAAGNLVSQPGLSGVVMGPANRLAAANGEQFAYDPRHHIAERLGPAGAVSYRYDSCDMLVAVQGPGWEWRAEYDAIGRRTRVWQGETEHHFFWDTDRLAAEIFASRLLRVYVYADSLALTPVAFVDYPNQDADPAEGAVRFVFSDQRGAPVLVEDAQGEAIWAARLSPYGAATVTVASGLVLNLRFPGHYFDAAIGLHYNRFRYYDPVLGRYIQSDPIGLGGGPNVYAYPAGPLVRVDVRGLTGGDGAACPGEKKAKPKEGGAKKEDTGAADGKPQAIEGSDWKFKPDRDEDRRGAPGNMHEEYRAAVDDAFARTGVPKDEFTVTKTATDINGKTVPVEWRVTSGPNKGAEVNVDDPRIVPSSEGPADPHVGYQTPGKRNSGGGQRGHIILDDVPASRGRLNDD